MEHSLPVPFLLHLILLVLNTTSLVFWKIHINSLLDPFPCGSVWLHTHLWDLLNLCASSHLPKRPTGKFHSCIAPLQPRTWCSVFRFTPLICSFWLDLDPWYFVFSNWSLLLYWKTICCLLFFTNWWLGASLITYPPSSSFLFVFGCPGPQAGVKCTPLQLFLVQQACMNRRAGRPGPTLWRR